MKPLRDLSAEAFFERRLREYCGRGFVFNGVTDTAERKRRIREAILEHELADEIIGSRGGVAETFREAFERHFGGRLVT